MANNDVDFQFSDGNQRGTGKERLVNERPRDKRGCKIRWKSKSVMFFVPVIFFGAIALVIYYSFITETEPQQRDYCPVTQKLPLGEPGMVQCYRKVSSKQDMIILSKTTKEGTIEILKSPIENRKHNTTAERKQYKTVLYFNEEWIDLKIHFKTIHCTDAGVYHMDVTDRYHRPIALNIVVYDPKKRDKCKKTKLSIGHNGVVNCGVCPPYGVQQGFLERMPAGSTRTKIWFFDMTETNKMTTDLDNRTSVSIEIAYGMALLKIILQPMWCSDHELLKWTFKSGNKTVESLIDVSSTSPILRCPSQLDYDVGDHGSFECNMCVNASYVNYEVYQSKNDNPINFFNSNVTEGERIGNKIWNDTVHVTAQLKAGVLKVEFEFVAYCIHDGLYSVLTEDVTKSTSIKIHDSPEDPYFDILGGLLNNTEATLKCLAKTGCTRQDIVVQELGIRVNDSKMSQTQEQFFSGFEQFSRTWITNATWHTYVTMALHNTEFTCEYTYLNSRERNVTLKAEYTAYVLEENFCTKRTSGCNYEHPYNRNLFLACLGIARPTVMICPASLRFIQDECFGECGP